MSPEVKQTGETGVPKDMNDAILRILDGDLRHLYTPETSSKLLMVQVARNSNRLAFGWSTLKVKIVFFSWLSSLFSKKK